MDDKQEGGVASRQESAKLHDDSALIESMAEDEGASVVGGAQVSGGKLAQDVATRDELRQVAGDAGITRPTGQDDQRESGQRKTGHEGAQGGEASDASI